MQSMYENVPPVSHVREVYGAECEAPYRAPPLPLRTLTYPIRHTLPRALGRPPALPAPWIRLQALRVACIPYTLNQQ